MSSTAAVALLPAAAATAAAELLPSEKDLLPAAAPVKAPPAPLTGWAALEAEGWISWNDHWEAVCCGLEHEGAKSWYLRQHYDDEEEDSDEEDVFGDSPHSMREFDLLNFQAELQHKHDIQVARLFHGIKGPKGCRPRV
jgi:hypothetical protein